jgi:outer membrane receptor protein involved in Fe transport
VVNAQLEYHDEDLGIDGTVLFNMFGERIFEAGFKGLPDAYEQPAASLDVVISYKIAKDASVKLKGGNLLDPRVEVTQGDGTLVSYRRGWNVSLGATYEFSL